jgi:CubicO group peptidase (beta-lactamase class C family)
MAGAAGGGALVTTTADLARFFHALLDGELFRNLETPDEMLTIIDATGEYDYGLRISKFVFPGGVEFIGHLGLTAGYKSLAGRLRSRYNHFAGRHLARQPDARSVSGFEILIPGQR